MSVMTTLPSPVPATGLAGQTPPPNDAIRRERHSGIVLMIACVVVPAVCLPLLLSWFWFDTPLVRLVPSVFHVSYWGGVVVASLAIFAFCEAWWLYESYGAAKVLGARMPLSPVAAAVTFAVPGVGAVAGEYLVKAAFPTESLKGSILIRWYVARLAASFVAPFSYVSSGFGEGGPTTDPGLAIAVVLVVAAMVLEIILIRQLLKAHRNVAPATAGSSGEGG
jgi:hypothetical protein